MKVSKTKVIMFDNFREKVPVLISKGFRCFNPWALVEQYSENANILKKAIKRIGGIKITFDGIIHNKDYKKLDCIVSSGNGKLPEFTFHFSHNDAQSFISAYQDPEAFYSFMESALYSILCDFGFNSTEYADFEEFCMEFGYNSDSIKDRELFIKCQEHYKQVVSVWFTPEELLAMPS